LSTIKSKQDSYPEAGHPFQKTRATHRGQMPSGSDRLPHSPERGYVADQPQQF